MATTVMRCLLRARYLCICVMLVQSSCFTCALWRGGNARTEPQIGVPLATLTSADGGQRILCQFESIDQENQGNRLALAEVCAQWQPALQAGTWLEVQPIEHAEGVSDLWRKRPADWGLEVLRDADADAAPRCWLVYPSSVYMPSRDLPSDFADMPGVRARNGLFGSKSLVFAAECRVTPVPVPPGARLASIVVIPCDPPMTTAKRTLLTPLALAADILLFPLELIWIGTWW